MDYKKILKISKKHSTILDYLNSIDSTKSKDSEIIEIYEFYDYDNLIESKLSLSNECKLVEDFYVNYFFYKILFEIDLIELNEFINYHFIESDFQEELLDVLEYKVIPLIGNIIEKQNIAYEIYNGNPELGFGLYFETQSNKRIFKPLYTYEYFYYLTALKGLSSDLNIRMELIKKYIAKYRGGKEDLPKLHWIGNASHLGFIISVLIEKGFINPPYKNGSPNIKLVSKQILNSFDFSHDSKPTQATLERYVNNKDKKHNIVEEQFTTVGFHIPYTKQFE